MADLRRPYLKQLGYLALIHMSLILQKGSQTCFYGNGRGQGRRKLTMQVLFKSLFISGLLTSYWLRQVSWPDPEAEQGYMVNNDHSFTQEGMRNWGHWCNLSTWGFHSCLVLHSAKEVTFIVGLERWLDVIRWRSEITCAKLRSMKNLDMLRKLFSE